jgi:glucokinase
MFIGIEIGGTKLQIGLGAGDGVMAHLWRGSVDVAGGASRIRTAIAVVVPEMLRKAGIRLAQIQGIGVGFGGPVDDDTHSTIKSHQVEGWEDFPLEQWLADTLRIPATLGNDADVAGLAEALFGAGRGMSPVFYVTVGSGIGGGLIIDQDIMRGSGKGAAEIGHLRLRSPSGAALPLEEIASGWGMERQAKQARPNEPPWTARDVADYAAKGNATALAILHNSQDALAEALCHVIALVCPKRIVIGGGVSLMGEKLFFEPLRQMVAERVFKPFAGLTEIVPAALGEEVVVHGALALARQR